MAMKIVADKNIPFLKGVAEKYGEVVYLAGADFSKAAIVDADALIVRTVTHFDESILNGSSVKLICSATIGYDHIDTDYCDRNNIIWKNAPGCNSSSVQQYVASALIMMSRLKGFDLSTKTIGIVGVGNVGKKVAAICEILGMRVLLNDPPRADIEGAEDFVPLEEIIKESDIITFHTPLTKEGEYKTYHLADTDFFQSLDKKPIIINSARGSIIDTQAIKEAIKKGLISGAVIDCWENEPDIDLEYLSMVDIATPHIAGYSADGKANATRMSLTSLANFFGLYKSPITAIEAPTPENSVIDLNNFSGEQRVYEAMLTSYSIMDDFKRLKDNPAMFKQLRNEYPLRREYPAYQIKNARATELQQIHQLGFRMEYD